MELRSEKREENIGGSSNMKDTPNPLETPIFKERVAFLKESQYWTIEKLEDLQISKLRYLIYYVSKNIPYYRDYLLAKGLSYEDFTSIQDIKKLPIIDKKIIRDNYDKFININYKKENLLHRSTGGSTGTPLTVFMDLDFLSRDKANTEHYMEALGLDIFSHKSLRIYGDRIPQEILDTGQYWYLVDNRKLVMSCYHINKETIRLYIKIINEFNPKYIHTRPSAILPIARYIISEKLVLRQPIKYIICDGECITEGQRDLIERVFRGRIYNVFGHTEGCILGYSCPHSRHLHFMPQVGIIEILDESGNDVTQDGEKGEIIATGFNNFVFPLIRYRTNDIAVHTNEKCDCKRNYRLIKYIEGRIQDYVITKDNELVPLSPAIFNYNDMDWKGIKEFKFIQEEKGKLILKIIKEKDNLIPDRDVADFLKTEIEKIFGNLFEITVVFTDNLEKTKVGKYRYLEQKCKLPEKNEPT